MAADGAPVRGAIARAASLRVRITVAAVLVVGLALGVGAVLLLSLLRANLLDYSRAAAVHRADSVASRLSAGGPTPSLAGIDDDEAVQVLDSNHTVLASTENAAGLPDLRTSTDRNGVRPVSFDDHPFVFVDKTVRTSDGTRTVVAGHDLEAFTEATTSVTQLLLIGCPLLLLLIGAMAWTAVGRALAPVDRILREAEGIGATELHRRLPEPARQDEIGRLARTMNLMIGRLDRSQRQQRRFISDAAHELRSPIAAIKQNVEVASTYPDAISTPELLEAVQAEADRLDQLTTGLLRLARLDERAPEPSRNPVDLDDLVLDQVHRLKSTTALVIDATAVSAGRVGGEEALLGQVLRNLVDNAERHARTRISFTLAEHDQSVLLSVDNDGPVIPPADRERVFERFVRLDEARTHDGGTGLGLAIVHDVVAAYRGTVVVSDGRLGGACFEVTLPRLSDAD